jgi:hypothetical protein
MINTDNKQRLNHTANTNKAKNETAYKAWLSKFHPLQIKEANNARDALRRLQEKAGKAKNGRKKRFSHIQDDRLVKRPVSPYAQFLKERVSSGDMNGMAVGEIGKLVAKEFKELGGAEKKVCIHPLFHCSVF